MELASTTRLEIPTDISFAELVLTKARQFGNKTALVDDAGGRSYTYSQLIEHVINCSVALSRLGLKHGHRLCLFLPNCIEYPVAFLAVTRLGAICVPVNYKWTKYELRDVVEDCQPTFFITTADGVDRVAYATSNLPSKACKVITVGNVPNYTSFESLLQPQDAEGQEIPPAAVNPQEDVATICYSSGTTGKPKGCMNTHFNYVSNGFIINETLSPRGAVDSDVTVVVLPMFHMFGIIIYFTHGLTTGQKLVVLQTFDVSNFLRLVGKYKATVLHVVPPMLDIILQTSDVASLRQSMTSVRHILSSAVRLSDSTAQQMFRMLPWVALSQAFGMTEVMLATCPRFGTWRIGSSGPVLSNVTAKVVDQDSRRALGPNKLGEVVFKSPSVLKGYWNNPEATRRSFDDGGWFKTGDLGYYDEDGNIFFVDRIKDLLKYKGYQVAPAELETVLLLHPDVLDAAVVGVKDEVAGDLPRALIVSRRPDVSVDDIVSFVNERVAPYKRLRGGVVIVENIPRTASGKILRRLLPKDKQQAVTSKL